MSKTPARSEDWDVRGLVRGLASGKEKERASAESSLKELAAQGMEPLLAVLAEGKRWQHARRRRGWWLLGAWLILYLVSGAVVVALNVRFAHLIFPAFNILANLGIGMVLVRAFLPGPVARVLATLDDPRAVPPLLDALSSRDTEPRQVAEEALVRLLPRLTAADAPLLDADQRARLRKLLGTSLQSTRLADAALTRAALKAVEHVGDEKALPQVERLAKTAAYPTVRAAAAACLPALRERLEQEKVVRGLLCPAGPAEGRPETLVQPAEVEPAPLERPTV